MSQLKFESTLHEQLYYDSIREEMSSIENELGVQNGLGSLVGGTGLPGLNSGVPWASNPQLAQLSQPTTMFYNLRWYLVSNFWQLLSQAYVEIGLIQKICNMPVDDAFRGGIEITSKQLDGDEIKELEIALDRNNDISNFAQAMIWTRLYGGGGVVIITDQDPETEIDLDQLSVDRPLIFKPADMWELYFDIQNVDGYNPVAEVDNFDYYSYYGVNLDSSRVIRLEGLTAPSFIRPRLRGWGFSVVEKLVRAINQYLKQTDLTFEVMDEFKIDVYRLKNLATTLMNPNSANQVQQRVALMNLMKNYQNAIVMDSEDEYAQKQLSFAGLADVMAGIRIQVASEMSMPLSKLFGTGAQGFNSGEDDIEVYNAMVESEVRNNSKYGLLKLVELRCQQKFGFIPDDMEVKFKPLRVMSAEQEENVKTQKFNRVMAAAQGGLIDQLQFAQACNTDNLLPIQIDTDVMELTSDTASASKVGKAKGGQDEKEVDETKDREIIKESPDSDDEADEVKADGKKGSSLSKTKPKDAKQI